MRMHALSNSPMHVRAWPPSAATAPATQTVANYKPAHVKKQHAK